MAGAHSTLQSKVLPNFVDSIDEKYNCIWHKTILRAPVRQLMCGHRICKACLDEENQESSNGLPKTCIGSDDECKEASLQNVFPDVGTDKELNKLKVYCSNQAHGCKNTVPWSDLEKHAKICEFAMQTCQNEGCKIQCLKTEMHNHVENVCRFKKQLCKTCNTEVTKDELNNGHESQCGKRVRVCKMADFGCDVEGASANLVEHESDITSHFDVMLSNLLTMQNQMKELTQTVMQLQTENHEIRNQNHNLKSENANLKESFIARLNRMEKSIAANNEKVIVHEQTSSENMQMVSQKLAATNDVIKVHEGQLANLQTNPVANKLPNMSQIERSIQNYDRKFAENEIRFRCLECTSYNGELIWKIANYRQRKQDAIEGRTLSLYSQPFFSGPYGYKMCARIYLNGDGLGKSSHISLFFVLMKGEYDSLLQWPFRQRVSLSILDQQNGQKHLTDVFRPDPTSTSFRQPVGEMNVASGCPLFANQSAVETERYIKNDTLYIKVQVKADE